MSTAAMTRATPSSADGARVYLLVVAGDASWMHPLPRDGAVVIGRVAGCDVQINDTAVSRQHARIDLIDGRATVTDLNSQNGTLVNNQRVERRELVGGDVLTIGTGVLVFHGPSSHALPMTMVGWDELRSLLARELDRVAHFGRELAVVHVRIGAEDRGKVAAAMTAHLRSLDAAAWTPERDLCLLLPEVDADGAVATIDGLLAALPASSFGYAVAPRDGCDADSILGGARAAAIASVGGTRASAAGAMREVPLGSGTAIIADPAMVRLYALVERLAAATLPVLVYGETGAGKELVAEALHHLSARKGKPRVALNCAALPEALVESELFGHERGAFSGAVATKPGIFEQADGGTVFLDEIGELPLQVQAKLLRVIETMRVTRVGDTREIAVDVRIVSATNRDLKDEAKRGRFRQDLYFRLSGATVWLPPLRDRPREIPILAQRFLADGCAKAGRGPVTVSPALYQRLAAYPWPGNVRELKNVCQFLLATVTGARLEDWHVDGVLVVDSDGAPGPAVGSSPALPVPLAEVGDPGERKFRPLGEEIEELERTRIAEALRSTHGNQTRAARAIGMPLRTFLSKLKRYGIGG